MSWKKDLLKGLVEVKDELARQQSVIAVYQMVTREQQRMIDKLLDRIQAKDFRELKAWTRPESGEVALERVGEFYRPEMDEELAGMVVEEREEGETGGKDS